MKENEKLQLSINFLADGSNDAADIANQLSRDLGEAAEVRLTTPETQTIPTKSADPGLVMQMISVTFGGIAILIQLAKLLLEIIKIKSGRTLILSNPKNGKTVALLETDSLEKIEKKMRKLLTKQGVKMTIKKR